jgi:hypothetical protein
MHQLEGQKADVATLNKVNYKKKHIFLSLLIYYKTNLRHLLKKINKL